MKLKQVRARKESFEVSYPEPARIQRVEQRVKNTIYLLRYPTLSQLEQDSNS